MTETRAGGLCRSFTRTYNGRGSFVEGGFETQLCLEKDGGRRGRRHRPEACPTLSTKAVLQTSPLMNRSKGAKLDFLARNSFRVASLKPCHSFPKGDISQEASSAWRRRICSSLFSASEVPARSPQIPCAGRAQSLAHFLSAR